LADARSCPVLAGPTAVGKTDLVLSLAAEFPIEVISLDSRQIYRGLRIGTAQPTAAEMAACRHHLVDFISPDEGYSARRYRDDFGRVYEDIVSRGRLPLLAGGAGMYLKALTDGLLELPEGSDAKLPALRAELDALTDNQIHDLLKAEDPLACTRLHERDRYRLQRALEITRLAGRPMTELMAAQKNRPALGLDFPTVVLARPVPELDARIAARTEAMLAAGWLEETRDLLAVHAPQGPGLMSLGYRQLVLHLQGESSLELARLAIVRETRQYAKRQRTWFRGAAQIETGAPDDPVVLEALRRLLADARRRLDTP
jgi:tRNA dimethylallyltransferase